MAWWKLTHTKEELNDADREHIAKLIKEGYTEGELNDDEECENCKGMAQGTDEDNEGCAECGRAVRGE